MSALVHEFRATYAFMERNANLVKRYWSWELVWMVYSIANSLSVSFIGMGMEQIKRIENAINRFLEYSKPPEPVFADIDAARIVWARSVSLTADRQLLEYFRDRRIWLLRVDAALPELVPYEIGKN